MIKRIIRIAILSALAIVGILGIIFTAQSSAFMGGGSDFFFFTVQSNIFIIAISSTLQLWQLQSRSLSFLQC